MTDEERLEFVVELAKIVDQALEQAATLQAAIPYDTNFVENVRACKTEGRKITRAAWKEVVARMSAYPTEALPFLAAQLLFDVAQMKRTAKQRLFGMEDLREARSRLRENLSNERDIRIRTRQKLAEANQKLIGAKLARKKGAATMLANSAKQTDKTFVRECWEEWQTTPLDRDGKKKYAGKAGFAKDMLTKCESLKSAAVISRWCLSWEKENITRPA